MSAYFSTKCSFALLLSCPLTKRPPELTGDHPFIIRASSWWLEGRERETYIHCTAMIIFQSLLPASLSKPLTQNARTPPLNGLLQVRSESQHSMNWNLISRACSSSTRTSHFPRGSSLDARSNHSYSLSCQHGSRFMSTPLPASSLPSAC